MNDTYVTLQGWVGTDVDLRDVGDTQCASFRVGSTPRYLRNREWVSGETQWYTINCWRALGRNVDDSIRKGDAVIVHGRVRVDVWEREGQQPSVSWVVDASFVGHDLTRGTSTFAKTQWSSTADPTEDEGFRRAMHDYEPSGPQLDAQGEVIEPAA